MNEKTEALRLANSLDARSLSRHGQIQAAAELRRLSIENEALGLHLSERMKDLARVEAQRDALLETLRRIGRYTGEGSMYSTPWRDIVADLGQTARAAIAKVEGENT